MTIKLINANTQELILSKIATHFAPVAGETVEITLHTKHGKATTTWRVQSRVVAYSAVDTEVRVYIYPS